MSIGVSHSSCSDWLQALEEQGQGRVLVVDGGGSLRCALLGDNIAEMAHKNGWSVSCRHLQSAHGLLLSPNGAAGPSFTDMTVWQDGVKPAVVMLAGYNHQWLRQRLGRHQEDATWSQSPEYLPPEKLKEGSGPA